MSLDNFQKGSCFSVNFDHSDSHRNCPDRKTCIKKVFWVQAQAYTSIHKLKNKSLYQKCNKIIAHFVTDFAALFVELSVCAFYLKF